MLRFATLLIALIAAVTATAKVETKQDRFTGKTEIATAGDWGVNNGRQQLSWSASVEGGAVSPIGLTFTVRDTSSRTMCSKIDFLADGAVVKAGDKPIYYPRPMGRKLWEFLVVSFEPAEFDKLAAASKVEYRICSDEYEFGPEAMQELKDIKAAIDRASSPPAG